MKPGDGRWILLRKRSERLRRDFQQLWGEAQDALAAEPDDLRAADVLSDETSKWEQAAMPVFQSNRELIPRLKSEASRRIEQFDQQLARELTAHKHVIHGEASLLIVDGIVHVDIDVKEGRISVNGTAPLEFSVSGVERVITEELGRLRKNLTPPKKMLEDLHAAYQREIRTNDKRTGSQVQTAAVLMQLAFLRQPATFRSNPQSRNFREYPREQFRADLFALLVDGSSSTKGHTFRYASGSDTSGAIFMMVPAMGRPAHVGRIWFEAIGE